MALGLVIIGGIKRIAAVTSKLVPFMAAAYGIGALAVIISNLEFVGPAFLSVFRDAFSGSAAAGGFLGASFAYAFNRGVNRGLFSNEAGQGSAPSPTPQRGAGNLSRRASSRFSSLLSTPS